jgi:hypothetical protein
VDAKGDTAVKIISLLITVMCVMFVVGCTTHPATKVKGIELGMTPGEVLERMGEPYTIRAAQISEGGKVTEIWEYVSPTFTFNPRTFLIFFQDGKLVQWGVETDITGTGLKGM